MTWLKLCKILKSWHAIAAIDLWRFLTIERYWKHALPCWTSCPKEGSCQQFVVVPQSLCLLFYCSSDFCKFPKSYTSVQLILHAALCTDLAIRMIWMRCWLIILGCCWGLLVHHITYRHHIVVRLQLGNPKNKLLNNPKYILPFMMESFAYYSGFQRVFWERPCYELSDFKIPFSPRAQQEPWPAETVCGWSGSPTWANLRALTDRITLRRQIGRCR